MKYIQFTYVDFATRIPVTVEPALVGPDTPTGVSPVFILERTFGPAPVIYGTSEDDYTPEEWMVEVTEEEFYTAYKAELKARARNKRVSVEQGGVELTSGIVIQTTVEDQNRVGNLVSALKADTSITSIDFEYSPAQWVTFTRTDALNMGKVVVNHVQGSFSWCKGVHERIDLIATLDEASAINDEIQKLGQKAVNTVATESVGAETPVA